MIVVTTPTGNIGRQVVAKLLEAGEPVRVIVRDTRKLDVAVRDRVDVVEGSHGDAAVVERAFAGADAVFWLAPADPTLTLEQAYLDFTRPAVAAFARLAVQHVVSVTALGRGTPWADKAGLVTTSIAMDDMIAASGVAFRGLAMPSFMDNTLQQARPIKAQGAMFGPFDPDKKMPTTATRDIGAAAAALLRDRSWTGQEEAPLLGPEDLSFNDMAAIVSEVTGREVRYQQIPFEGFRARLAERGVSESFQEGYVTMMRAKNEGMDNVAGRGGGLRAPTTYREWCAAELKPALSG